MCLLWRRASSDRRGPRRASRCRADHLACPRRPPPALSFALRPFGTIAIGAVALREASVPSKLRSHPVKAAREMGYLFAGVMMRFAAAFRWAAIEDGGALTAAIGPAEQPGLAAERHAAQRPFSGVVPQAGAAIIEEAAECGPASEHVVYRLREIVVARELGKLFGQPGVELGHERRAESCRTARRSAALLPFTARSMSNSASIRCTASRAIG